MFSQMQSRLSSVILCGFLACSCLNKGTSSSSNSTRPNGSGDENSQRTGEDNDFPSGQKECKSARILEVSDNGSHVISRLTTDRSKIVNWNLKSGQKVSFLNFPIKPYRVSPNGKYLIRQINYKKFQVIEFDQKNKRGLSKMITLNASYSPMPVVNFSADSKSLVMNYRPYGRDYNHRIDIYHLKQQKFISTLKASNIWFAKVTRDSRYYLIAFKDRYFNIFQKVDAETTEVVYEIKLNKYSRLKDLHVGKKAFFIKDTQSYHAYDLDTGDYLYSKDFKFVFDIGSQGKHALITDSWNELKVIDLYTGDIRYEKDIPTGLILSTCQLVDRSLTLLCKDSINQGKISIWNLDQDKSKTACY